MTAGQVGKTYDIFEIRRNGEPIWRTCAEGRESALARFEELAKECASELWAVELASGQILAGVTAVDNPQSRLPNSRNMLLEIIGGGMEKNRQEGAKPNSGDAMGTDVIQRGGQALTNCEEMRAVNAHMLDLNHQIMTSVRRRVESSRQDADKPGG